MSDDIRESTCCPSSPVTTGEDAIFGYRVDRNEPHPPPVVTCPDSFTAWMVNDQYVIPDFSDSILTDGQCALDSDFTIAQNPTPGTIFTIGGEITILITVTDRFGNSVDCSFNIDIRNPNTSTPSVPPNILPPWVYQPYLFAYWSANDTLCTPGLTDQSPPCWWRRDLTEYLGNNSPRHLSNAGNVIFIPLESFVDGFSSGPTYDKGSAWSNNQANAYQFVADDSGLRLLSTSFTMRLCFKLVSMSDTWALAGKFNAVGFRLKIVKNGSEYRLSAELKNNSDTLATSYYLVALNTWTHAAMIFDASSSKLSLYVNGVLIANAVTSSGFILSGDVDQFRIGQPAIVGSSGDALLCWPMETSALEDSIGSRDLITVGSASIVAGKINNAVQMTYGSGGNYLERADEAALRLSNTDFTFRMWMKLVSAPTAQVPYLSKFGSSLGYQFGVNASDCFYTFNNRGVVAAGTLGARYPLGVWRHSVFTWNNTTKILKHYIDGLEVQSISTFLSPDATNSAPLRLLPPSSTIQFDEVGLWASPWSPAEVGVDFNAGLGTACATSMSSGAAEIFTDEVGIWLQAWPASRIAEDYALMT